MLLHLGDSLSKDKVPGWCGQVKNSKTGEKIIHWNKKDSFSGNFLKDDRNINEWAREI